MPSKRQDKAYIQGRIRELYRNNTAEGIVEILNGDEYMSSRVSLSSVRNDISRMRSQENLEHKGRTWSKEDQLMLEAAYGLGAEIPAIAERMNRTVPAIHARISQRGLANRKITEHQEESVRILLTTTDQSLTEIAVRLGIKYDAVRHVWEGLKASGRVRDKRRSSRVDWKGGSMTEKLLRERLVETYGSAVVLPPGNRAWSDRHYEIDVPIVCGDQKFAIEVNHVRIHAYRRNIDYTKRRLAESLGWVWINLWISEPVSVKWLDKATETVRQIIEERQHGRRDFYDNYVERLTQLERTYYAPDQPPYDPKEGAPFGEPWTVEDINILMQFYVSTSIEELQRILRTSRTRFAIIHKARYLGIHKDRGFYCYEEDAIILQNFASAPRDMILKKLPGRTWAGISGRARHLGVHRERVKVAHNR